jgi:hypothetical protein
MPAAGNPGVSRERPGAAGLIAAPRNGAVLSARGLFDLVGPFRPAVEGDELVLAADVPADLEPVVGVLHTGLRAQLAGRRWYGCDGSTGRVYELNPAAPIPSGITLLCVEGDKRWDRVSAGAKIDRPGLFADGKGGGR